MRLIDMYTNPVNPEIKKNNLSLPCLCFCIFINGVKSHTNPYNTYSTIKLYSTKGRTMKNYSGKPHGIRTILHGLCVSLLFLFVAYACASDTAFNEDVEKFFDDQKKSFDAIAESPSIRKTSLSQVDRYFVAQLKKNQTFYTLIKTNTKGVLINEVVRGMTPERKFKDVGTQKWYPYVSRRLKEYHGFLKDENGRFYLFWAKPILKNPGTNAEQFVGAVAAKVDIWDCFHKFASDIDKPFLVLLGRKSLYSNKWKRQLAFEEKLLRIPGIKKISIRYEKSAAPLLADTGAAPDTLREIAATDTTPPVFTPVAESKPNENSTRNPFEKMSNLQKIVLFSILLAVLVLIVYLSKLAAKIRDWRIRRKIEKEDNLFR